MMRAPSSSLCSWGDDGAGILFFGSAYRLRASATDGWSHVTIASSLDADMQSPVAASASDGIVNFLAGAPRSAGAKTSSGSVLTQALAAAFRFHWNRLRHASLALLAGKSQMGPVRHARARAGNASAELPYCLGHDNRGILCGVQPAWLYLNDFAGTGREKITLIRKLLAQLPGSVTLHFSFQSELADAPLVREAFASTGFTILDWKTYIYTPPADYADLVDTFTGKSIKGTLRRARRDLEVVDISIEEFIEGQRANLAASGKKTNRNDNLDELILAEAAQRKCARILGARRKPVDGNPGPAPIDAALVCLWDEASRNMLLWRLSYREYREGPFKPHVDASKLLVLAAMEDCAARKFTLDTDGYTSGIAKMYALFGPGIFQLADRLHCERESLWATLTRYYPSLRRHRWLGRLLGVG